MNSNSASVNPTDTHRKLKGKIAISPKAKIKSQNDLAILYTPGVAKPAGPIL